MIGSKESITLFSCFKSIIRSIPYPIKRPIKTMITPMIGRKGLPPATKYQIIHKKPIVYPINVKYQYIFLIDYFA